MTLSYRKAIHADLPTIIKMMVDDELGASRECYTQPLNPSYESAFRLIDADPNQFLMVVLSDQHLVGTCHLTLLPSLSLQGTTRLNIESVRVAKDYRGQKIGAWMITQALAYGRQHGAKLAQLTTNKKRHQAKVFYERLGFTASHEGMKRSLED